MKRGEYAVLMVTILVAVALMGVGTKFYRGRFETWFHNYAGGILYEVFWIVLFGALFPGSKLWLIAGSVFVVTCGLEVLQLWRPPFLQAIRSNFLGKALLGNGFDPSDFAYYVIGSVIGWVVCWRTKRYSNPSPVPPA
jgi:hypothetical protein